MTEQELREIDKRVALALGFSVWQEQGAPGCWYVLRGDIIYATIPHYTTDPAASDLVRQEIERRGWSYSIYCDLPDTHKWSVYLKTYDADRHYSVGYAHSEVSIHVALCLAFLAACEAQKEGGAQC